MKSKIAFFILRVGMGIVFLFFGAGKLRGDVWAETMKNMVFFKMLPWAVGVSVFMTGVLEIVTGFFLVAGFFVRIAAIAAALELIAILILLRFSEIRDIGLLAAAIYMVLVPSDFLSLDRLRIRPARFRNPHER